jgi:hypothetical protein
MLKPLQNILEEAPSPRPQLVLLEVAVVTLLLPAVGFWQRPHDPFFLQGGFPWVVLAPLVLGLRYGFAQGLGSAAALCLMMFACLRAGRLGVPEYPGSTALGLLLIAMLAGEFCDMWQRRQSRLREVCYHHHLARQKFTRSYHLLALSHEQLAGRVLANTRSLREAMTYLRERAATVQPGSSGKDKSELYRLMMEVLSSFSHLQVAALYLVDEHGIMIPRPVARLGDTRHVPLGDPLLVQALKTGQLTCVRPADIAITTAEGSDSPSQAGSLLAALPLVDVHGRMWGIVAVQAMPFEALSRDPLNLLAVISGHMGDLMALAEGGGMHQFHTCLLRCHRDAREHNLPAMLVGISIDSAQAPPHLLQELLDQDRALDQPWLTRNSKGHGVLMLVMPLTDAEGARSFVQRIEDWHQGRYGKPLSDGGVQIHQQKIDGVGRAEDKLQALKEACGIHGS